MDGCFLVWMLIQPFPCDEEFTIGQARLSRARRANPGSDGASTHRFIALRGAS